MAKLLLLVLLCPFIDCGPSGKPGLDAGIINPFSAYYKTISEIPTPTGFERVKDSSGSFTEWLRQLPLKEDKTVYLYNGKIKPNQSAQFAVVDMPRSKTDLQQCADVVMRLRAEYLFANKKYAQIIFTDYNGKSYKWQGGNDREQFERYLNTVFAWCGSASLEKQLKPVAAINDLQTGDVFIKGGFPGHAMIVTDIAINKNGKKIYLLIQGYQPAQDMHVVINPTNPELSPWYEVTAMNEIITPEWIFYKNQLRRW